MVIRDKPTQETLEQLYITIHNLINNQECYYTQEQIEKLKKNKKNIFLERGKWDERRRY